jgi:hypothetical protein
MEDKLKKLKMDERREEERKKKTREVLDDHRRVRYLEAYKKKKEMEQNSIDQMRESNVAKQEQISSLLREIEENKLKLQKTNLGRLSSFMSTYSYYNGAKKPPYKIVKLYICLLENDTQGILDILEYKGGPYTIGDMGKIICGKLGHLILSAGFSGSCVWCNFKNTILTSESVRVSDIEPGLEPILENEPESENKSESE